MAKARAPRPARDTAQIGQLGLEAHTLAVADRAAVEPRLPAGLIDGLAADLATFGTLVPGAIQSRGEKRAATQGQNTAGERAAALISAIRTSVKEARLGADVNKAWGVGQKLSAGTVKGVRAAGDLILARAAASADEVRAAGVLPADLETLGAALATLASADTQQESGKIASKDATGARNAAGRRIELAIRRIGAAGALQFAADPVKAARYAAFLSGPSKKPKASPAPPA